MPRARTKKELLLFGKSEFEKLMDFAETYEKKEFLQEPIFDNRTIKDILAHLYAWHKLELTWYKEGMNGGKPEIPAPGYTFKTAPALNEKLYQDYKAIGWEDIKEKLGASHKELMSLVGKHTEEELFTKMKYAWTGSTSMGTYFASALSSHYNWASELLRKKLKSL